MAHIFVVGEDDLSSDLQAHLTGPATNRRKQQRQVAWESVREHAIRKMPPYAVRPDAEEAKAHALGDGLGGDGGAAGFGVNERQLVGRCQPLALDEIEVAGVLEDQLAACFFFRGSLWHPP